jgi:hypothetical protein
MIAELSFDSAGIEVIYLGFSLDANRVEEALTVGVSVGDAGMVLVTFVGVYHYRNLCCRRVGQKLVDALDNSIPKA